MLNHTLTLVVNHAASWLSCELIELPVDGTVVIVGERGRLSSGNDRGSEALLAKFDLACCLHILAVKFGP